ncbi:MAG: FixH family protein [Myxococcales bacterium]|nr:FixH family protein [Myxococcales bacterium]
MSTFKSIALALALVTPLAACDSGEDQAPVETRAVEDFSDGMVVQSDSGLFHATLWSDSGTLEVGRNDLVLRLGFADPNDQNGEEARGLPIAGARLDLDAWMPDADTAMAAEPTIEYLGDGEYRIENVVLGEGGVWNVDVEIAVGDNLQESISLAFDI